MQKQKRKELVGGFCGAVAFKLTMKFRQTPNHMQSLKSLYSEAIVKS